MANEQVEVAYAFSDSLSRERAAELIDPLRKIGLRAAEQRIRADRTVVYAPCQLGIVLLDKDVLSDRSLVAKLTAVAEKYGRALAIRLDSCAYEHGECGTPLAKVAAVEWTSVGDAVAIISRLLTSPSASTRIGGQRAEPKPTEIWNDAPRYVNFLGRVEELRGASSVVLENISSILAVTGIGGVGKSAFALEVARSLAYAYDHVLWVSMQTMPSIEELIARFDSAVGGLQAQSEDPDMADYELLADRLARTSILLVLDNYESILKSGDGLGSHLQGFENYSRLLSRLAGSQLAGCLMITSREEPEPIPLLKGQTDRVRVLRLEGLDQADAIDFIEQQGLRGSTGQLAALSKAYDNNPFGMQLACAYVAEVLQGHISSLLDGGMVVLGDVARLVEEHLSRLTDLERRVLTWLALARRPMVAEDWLRRISAASRAEVSNALIRLSRRCLVWSSTDGFDMHEITRTYLVESLLARCGEEVVGSVAGGVLDEYPLVDGREPDYVRLAQRQQHIEALMAQLLRTERREDLRGQADAILDQLRDMNRGTGHTATNLLLILDAAGLPLSGLNLSNLALVAARLDEVEVQDSDLSGVRFTDCSFSDDFGAATAVAWSPDGAKIAAGTFDGRLRVWECGGYGLIANIAAHGFWISGIAFIPGSTSIVVLSSNDGDVSIWDIDRLRIIAKWKAHGRPVRDLAIDQSGSVLATVSEDGSIALWRLPSGESLARYTVSSARLKAVAFCRHARDKVMVAGDEGRVYVIDMNDGSKEVALSSESWIRTLDVISESVVLAGCDDGSVTIFNPAAEGQAPVRFKAHESRVWSVTYFASDGMVASAGQDGSIKLWTSTPEPSLRVSLEAHTSWVRGIAFSPDGSQLASAGEDQTIRIWDVQNGLLERTIAGYALRCFSITMCPPGLVSSHGNHNLYAWRVDEPAPRQVLRGHLDQVFKVASDLAGLRLASGSDDGEVLIWARRSTNGGFILRHRLTHHGGWIGALAFAPGRVELATGADDRTIGLVDPAEGRVSQMWPAHDGRVSGLAYITDDQLASSSEDGTLAVWSLGPMPRRLLSVNGDSGPLYGITVRGKTGTLFTAGSEGMIREWSSVSGQLVGTYESSLSRPMWAVAIDEASGLVYGGGDDGVIRGWSLESRDLVVELSGHSQQVWALAVGPEGILYSSGEDGTIRSWDSRAQGQTSSRVAPRRYEGTRVVDVEGLSLAQIQTLESLGAVAVD